MVVFGVGVFGGDGNEDDAICDDDDDKASDDDDEVIRVNLYSRVDDM